MDVDDFILAEVDEKGQAAGLNKLEDGMKKMHLELLQEEERPASQDSKFTFDLKYMYNQSFNCHS